MKFKLRYILFLLLVSFKCIAAEELDSRLQNAIDLISENKWPEAKAALIEYKNRDLDSFLLWGLWYGGQSNPEYNKHLSTKYMEESAILGSPDSQLMLVGRYLFSKDTVFTNYSRGVYWANKVHPRYLKLIEGGKDIDGEYNRIVGKFYLFGIGVDKNLDLALKHYQAAAELGDSEAKESLEGIKRAVSGKAKSEVK